VLARSQSGQRVPGRRTGPARGRLLQRHIEACPTCPPVLTALVGTRDALRRGLQSERGPDSVIPPTIAARLAALTSD